MLYRVTASALKLRDAPKTGNRLMTMPKGATVSTVDDGNPTPGWLRVSWNGTTGYASAEFLEPAGAGSPGAGAPVGWTGPVPAAPSVDQRDRDMAKLHPAVRDKIATVVKQLNETHNIPFRVFEAFRTPERQAALYAQGRTKPGKIVTNAEPWQSMHQYGLAADLVLFADGQWSWGGKASDWKTMHEVAESQGLQFLSWEAPHVEIKNSDWREYQKGNFPPGGDESWYDAVMGAAQRWKVKSGKPAGPDPAFEERPPLDEQGGS